MASSARRSLYIHKSVHIAQQCPHSYVRVLLIRTRGSKPLYWFALRAVSTWLDSINNSSSTFPYPPAPPAQELLEQAALTLRAARKTSICDNFYNYAILWFTFAFSYKYLGMVGVVWLCGVSKTSRGNAPVCHLQRSEATRNWEFVAMFSNKAVSALWFYLYSVGGGGGVAAAISYHIISYRGEERARANWQFVG